MLCLKKIFFFFIQRNANFNRNICFDLISLLIKKTVNDNYTKKG